MKVENIEIGDNPPENINVVIENPTGGPPVKYEMDKDTGALFVDRFMFTAMHYPGNYGFIPHTLSGDEDPMDVLVMGEIPVMPGAVLPSRPVGVLIMEDESGMDEKIIAVPVSKLHPYHESIESHDDLHPIQREQIEHFFAHYKDLEKNKWVKIVRWDGAEQAHKLIREGIERAGSGQAA